MDNCKNVFVKMQHCLYKKWTAKRQQDYYLFYFSKKSDSKVNKLRHIGKQEQTEIEHILILSQKTRFWKPLSPNGTEITKVP